MNSNNLRTYITQQKWVKEDGKKHAAAIWFSEFLRFIQCFVLKWLMDAFKAGSSNYAYAYALLFGYVLGMFFPKILFVWQEKTLKIQALFNCLDPGASPSFFVLSEAGGLVEDFSMLFDVQKDA